MQFIGENTEDMIFDGDKICWFQLPFRSALAPCSACSPGDAELHSVIRSRSKHSCSIDVATNPATARAYDNGRSRRRGGTVLVIVHAVLL